MFRFTIRDVLWLTTVVAITMTWMSERHSLSTERAKAKAEAESFAAKRRELDKQFLKLVESTDQLNEQFQRQQKLRQ